ncbi:MAG: SDR family NAD(P)-dependent oxidoreductase [Rhodothermales bacterium]|nr:SDR family NAD(P)-dependent oxidoreductase [Rhodothermales bacterium]
MKTDRRTCVVTGGAGFIGSHLVDALLARGDNVVAVDNLSTGHADNLEQAQANSRFRFVNLDVSQRSLMAPLIANCDELYHLASYVGVKLAAQTSSQTILNNLRSIDTILDLVTHYKPRFLLTSTSEIYGKALDVYDAGPDGLSEHADRVYGSTEVHRWSYAGIKSVEEFLTLAKHHEEGLHTVIVRLFNVIGPRQVGRHGPVVPRFIEQALSGEPISIYGDGSQRRCFTFVDDAIQTIVSLMRRDDTAGEIFNVGGTDPISISELAELIVKETGGDSSVEYIPYETAYGTHFEDVHLRIPNTRKLDEWMGKSFETDIADAIRKTIAAHPRVGNLSK